MIDALVDGTSCWYWFTIRFYGDSFTETKTMVVKLGKFLVVHELH
jgi:hypothetical protein